jgi:hypothetical protein
VGERGQFVSIAQGDHAGSDPVHYGKQDYGAH